MLDEDCVTKQIWREGKKSLESEKLTMKRTQNFIPKNE